MFNSLKQIRSYVMTQLGHELINTRNIAPDVVDSAVNAAQADLAKYTMGLESVYTTNSVVDQEYYELNDNFYKPRRVFWNGDRVFPQATRPDKAQGGKPTHYRIIGGVTTTPRIALYPIPDEIQEIQVLVDLFPTKMTDDSDEPEFNQAVTMAICMGALYYLTFGTSKNQAFKSEWNSLKLELRQQVNSDIAEPMPQDLDDGIGEGGSREEVIVYRY